MQVDFGRMMERMRRLRAELSAKDSARRFRDRLGVDVFIGAARFRSRHGRRRGETFVFARPASRPALGLPRRRSRASLMPAISPTKPSSHLPNFPTVSLYWARGR